ncbi:hypothetical protein QBC43DRAFT_85957 [Cladorrhinum sp. PSN259]|nr:hypothetical protein QBC43DRAFT_85957 [Cladorrhinum sp. PSN259]
MAFIQDPRMRQRWNQISHTTEAVTENAAAGIWTFNHRYINPCLDTLGRAVDSCMGPCIGDREERARRARERDRGARRTRAEYSFDFYDDWDDYYGEEENGGGSGVLGGGNGGGWSWGPRSDDWDRLLAGTGASRKHHAAETVETEQPRRKRGMSYGTRGPRRKASADEDPNVIPRTAPLGFLGRLPFKIVGSLRYKPSAANLRDHPGAGQHGDSGLGREEVEEHEPLLGGRGDDERRQRGQRKVSASRARSNTTESGDTSSSFRSRGDLFPSDGEGEEDAVPLDEEQFTVALDRVDDRSSNRTRSSKGKRPADGGDKGLSRTVSRTTLSSEHTPDEIRGPSLVTSPFPEFDDAAEISVPSLEELQQEEEQARREEDEELERRRRAASQLAMKRGLSVENLTALPDDLEELSSEEERTPTVNGTIFEEAESLEVAQKESKRPAPLSSDDIKVKKIRKIATVDQEAGAKQFVPARLPHFG